jgi:hypothetical protein
MVFADSAINGKDAVEAVEKRLGWYDIILMGRNPLDFFCT